VCVGSEVVVENGTLQVEKGSREYLPRHADGVPVE
jgi:hypothetical protein